jgi:hypothetical protein
MLSRSFQSSVLTVSDEREEVAEELRRVRDAVRERALLQPRTGVLPPARAPRNPEGVPAESTTEAPETPGAPRPDNTVLNTLWKVVESGTLSWRGRLRRLFARTSELRQTALRQEAFNSRQVQFDNELLAYIDARLDATHRQYDSVLGIHSRHMAEIDQRHLIVQEELVAHVHDLVRRIDLVLSEAERGRLSLEYAVKEVRARLKQIEERLPRG